LVRDTQDAEIESDRYRIEIAAELAKPDDERSSERQAQLTRNLTLASVRAGEFAARVQKDFPDYVRLTGSEPVELVNAQAQLGPRQALLSFVVGFNASYGLLLTRSGLVAKPLNASVSSVTGDIAVLRRAFRPQLGVLPDFSLGTAHTLYAQLMEPFADELKSVDHLFLASGPVLANLPFGLLITAAPAGKASYGDAAWLIRSMAISQVPSPRSFVLLRQAERARVAAPRPFLGLGDPLLTGTGQAGALALETLALNCRGENPMPASLLNALPPLHDTAQEVGGVARALGADADSVLLGRAANEAALRARPLDQYRVLYFATHGLLPGELHCQAEPGLVLSPPVTPASATDSDGLLEASEVAALKLNADLVALSACNTAAAGGARFGGDALQGLADAFFNAGARAVLASHWEVPSAETAKLMADMFQRYGRDRQHGLAEALRQSQLDLVQSQATAHPYYWAAFTLIGVGETVQEIQQANGGGL
jgi:CHAT domain-containing protein